jgi:hypothetical protein
MITKIVKISMQLNFIEIYSILFKSSPEICTKMKYNVLPSAAVFSPLFSKIIVLSSKIIGLCLDVSNYNILKCVLISKWHLWWYK